MSDVLWNLTPIQERIAAAMWKEEARRAAPQSVAERRTLEVFRQMNQQDQDRWMGLADAALEALFGASE